MLWGLKILYEDANLLVVDKPPGISVLRAAPLGRASLSLTEREETIQEESLAEELSNQFPELLRLGEKYRYGIAHRLDKDTSGVLLVAKTKKTLEYLQAQFKERKIEKKYLCLVIGNIKEDTGIINTLLGRSPHDRRKQKTYEMQENSSPSSGGVKREAITQWDVLERYKEYTFLRVHPRTGRKHQIRAHLASIRHPLAGDKLYGFKGQPTPAGLTRQFLHAASLKITLENGLPAQAGKEKIFTSPLPKDLQAVIDNLQTHDDHN